NLRYPLKKAAERLNLDPSILYVNNKSIVGAREGFEPPEKQAISPTKLFLRSYFFYILQPQLGY
ncbi:MAG: hypothetical protein ACQCN4_06950, partial [Candidatus Bathyarchaeia archaeon]